MGDLKLIRPNAALTPSVEEKAARLEELAELVRSGDIVMRKGLVVFLDGDGQVQYRAFGERTEAAEAVGILAYAQRDIMAGDGE